MHKRITFITGKGGVGKTSVAAALALVYAARGKRTLVCELGSDGHLQRVFADALAGAKVGHLPRQVRPNVDIANFVVSDGLVATLGSIVPFEKVVRAVVNNRILQLFMETAPSISEAVLLDALMQQVTRVEAGRPVYDNIFVDMPASGHALTLLTVPKMIGRLVKRGPVARKADDMEAAILSPNVAQILLVSLPEALPVQETAELSAKLREATALPQVAVCLNGIAAERVSGEERALLDELLAQPQDAALHRHARHLRDALRRDEEALARLGADLGLPVWQLPQVLDAAAPNEILGSLSAALASYLHV